MAIGLPDDFRTPTFMHVERFPGQMTRGGVGSGYLPSINPPAGQTGLGFPPIGIPNIQGGSFNFAFPNLTMGPPIAFPGFGTGGGGGGITGITVIPNSGTPIPGVDTINFTGTGFVSVNVTSPTSVDVDYQDTGGGGGGGTTLVYGKITAYTKTAGIAKWTYTVTEYVVGVAGASLTMYNLLEKSNTSTNAYGFTTTGAGGDQISGTQLYVKPVPVDAWVRAESTSDPDGGTAKYWFSAPNPVDGTCT
jgi:hypothetical protein